MARAKSKQKTRRKPITQTPAYLALAKKTSLAQGRARKLSAEYKDSAMGAGATAFVAGGGAIGGAANALLPAVGPIIPAAYVGLALCVVGLGFMKGKGTAAKVACAIGAGSLSHATGSYTGGAIEGALSGGAETPQEVAS